MTTEVATSSRTPEHGLARAERVQPLRFLRYYGYGSTDIKEISRLGGGIENVVYRISTTSRDVVLRIFPHRSHEEIAFECDILRSLAGGGAIRTPVLIPTNSGLLFAEEAGFPSTLYTFLPGRRAYDLDACLVDDVCGFVRWFHRTTEGGNWNRDVKGFRLHRIGAMLEKLLASGAFDEHAPWYSHLLLELERFPLYAHAFGRYPERLIHCDLVRNNLLLGKTGRLTAVLDFDDAYVDCALLEYAGIARGSCFSADFELKQDLVECVRENAEKALGRVGVGDLLLALRYVCLRFYVYTYYWSRIRNPYLDDRLCRQDLLRWRALLATGSLSSHGGVIE